MRGSSLRRRPALWLGLAILSTLATGAPAEPSGEASEGVQSDAPELELSDVDPLALTPAMQEFLDARVESDLPRRSRLHALMEAIFDPEDGLGVVYGNAGTRSAAGTFEAKTGNCLSFTILFTAMARYLDLETSFVEADEVTGWSQSGEVLRSHWHVYVEVEIDNAIMKVDFLPVDQQRYLTRRRIGDRRITAHFHNNLGAEAVAGGRIEEARARFERALELDPSFLPARINLGVAHKRAGRLETAEEILLSAARDDPGMPQAATNLAALYLARGRPEKARLWREQAQAHLERNPYHHFRLALQDLARNRPQRARVHLRRALRRKGDDPVFHEKLAEASLQLGDEDAAGRSLRRALDLTEDPDARRALERRFALERPMDARSDEPPEGEG